MFFYCNLHFLKTDSRARYQGYKFYFREGFCWIDVNSTYLKSRIKTKGVFDVLSMSLFTLTDIPDWYFVCIINSELISLYVDNFINNTSHFQINDARQLPIIIPDGKRLEEFKRIAFESIELKKKVQDASSDAQLSDLQKELDHQVMKIYSI